MDEKLMKLVKQNASPEEWKTYYDRIIKILPEEIDHIVTSLAKELKLSSLTSTV